MVKATVLDCQRYDEHEYADTEGGVVRHHVYGRTVTKKTPHVLEAEDWDKLFESFYKANNTLRYCNDYWYEFEDAKIQKEYRVWVDSLSHARSFNLYYGDGTVD